MRQTAGEGSLLQLQVPQKRDTFSRDVTRKVHASSQSERHFARVIKSLVWNEITCAFRLSWFAELAEPSLRFVTGLEADARKVEPASLAVFRVAANHL